MSKLKVAYFTIVDPLDKRSWSGIPYYLGKALQNHDCEFDFLGPVKIPSVLNKTYRAFIKLNRLIFKKEYFIKHSLFWGWYAARILEKRMKGKTYDFIFAPAATAELAFLKTNIHVLHVGDSTFKLMSNFYLNEYENISRLSRWEGNYLEKKALQKSNHTIFTSHWAANSAMKDYNYDQNKIFITPFGANMDFIPGKEIIFKKIENKKLTLLFLAVDWNRKGGSIAFETLKYLNNDLGLNAKLIVCGCVPPKEFTDPNMEVIPFINKNIPEQHNRFVELLSTSHFLILPTRADCSLIVGCESNAYGMPVVTTDTGGVSEVVKNDVNGYCLPLNAQPKEYALKIAALWKNKDEYTKMITRSRNRFEDVLNWDVWATYIINWYKEINKPPTEIRSKEIEEVTA